MEKMRWRYGDTNPVMATVDRETVVRIGDLVCQEAGRAVPVSDLSRGQPRYAGRVATAFLGVAMQRSARGNCGPVRVATTGVFEFDCEPAAFCLGDPLRVWFERLRGPSKDRDQTVAKTKLSWEAIGYCARREPEPAKSVYVDIRSAVMHR